MGNSGACRTIPFIATTPSKLMYGGEQEAYNRGNDIDVRRMHVSGK